MFINMPGLGDVREPKPVPAGRYDLTIATAEFVDAKSPEKAPNVKVSIGIDGHLDAPNLTHFISLPKQGEEASKTHFKLLMIKRFLHQFGIPYDQSRGFEVSDFPGARCNAQVNLSEPDPDTGAIYNRLALDRLPTEEKESA